MYILVGIALVAIMVFGEGGANIYLFFGLFFVHFFYYLGTYNVKFI